MRSVCEQNKCAGCMACIDICPKSAIKIVDSIEFYNAVIDAEKCINCKACENVCQELHPAKKREPIFWKQGWTNNLDRSKSSSGGLGYALASAFIKEGGIVAACVFANGEFKFQTFDNLIELDAIRGSKYVKSNPIGIYKKIREIIKERKVLFLGLPCQVSALLNYIGEHNADNLLTIDLICHGTPSPNILTDYYAEHRIDIRDIKNISFRKNSNLGLIQNKSCFTYPFNMDAYSLAFLNSVCYTENCYNCAYASWNRVSDITLGDSWGSELNDEEKKRGISLVLCQTLKGKNLIDIADLSLANVDRIKAVEANHQLQHSSVKTKKYDVFMQSYLKNNNVSEAVRKCFPKHYIKQIIKTILYKLGIYKWGEVMYRITFETKS